MLVVVILCFRLLFISVRIKSGDTIMAICASVVIVHALLIQEDEDRADPQNDDAEAEETCNFLLTRAYCGSDCGA